jgi:hypothetical protein
LIASGFGFASVAVSGRGIMAVFSPARYTSPPALEKNSGENPKFSVANTAWHISSVVPSLKKGFLRRREWPARGAIGILVVALGKSVEKTRGDQAPDAMIRRVHGTDQGQLCYSEGISDLVLSVSSPF